MKQIRFFRLSIITLYTNCIASLSSVTRRRSSSIQIHFSQNLMNTFDKLFLLFSKYIQHVQPLIMLLFTTSVSLSTLYLFLSEHYFYHNSFTPTPFMQYTIMIRYGYEYGCPPSLYLLMMMVCLVFPDKSSHVGRMYVFFFWVRLYEMCLTGLWTISLFLQCSIPLLFYDAK